MVEPVSLSAPETVQVSEYIAPTVGVATPASTPTEIVGSGDEKDEQGGANIFTEHLLLTLTSIVSVCTVLPTVALHV